MSTSYLFAKDPDEVLDYDLDWGNQMTLDTDTIASSTWTVPVGITKNSSTNSTTATKIWVSGGTAGQTYALVNEIVTAGGRTFERTVNLKVKER